MSIINKQQQSINPSKGLESTRAKKADPVNISGKMGGRSISQSLKAGFSLIIKLAKIIFKTIQFATDGNQKMNGKKPIVMKGSEISQLKIINTLRTIQLLKRTDQFVKNDQSGMISTLKNRKPGEGITVAIEKKISPAQAIKNNIKVIQQNKPNQSRKETEKEAMSLENQRQAMLARAIPVYEALNDAHSIINATQELEGLQQLAQKNPRAVSLSDQKLINQRLKEIQPLAKQAKEALASPNYRNLFERIFMP